MEEPLAVVLARQIIALYNDNLRLTEQVAGLTKYKEMYEQELTSRIRHSEKMMGNLMDVLMTPGVAEAFVNNTTIKENSDEHAKQPT